MAPGERKINVTKVDWVNEAFRADEESKQVSANSTVQDTQGKSLQQYTREALPRADHYRNALTIHDHFNRPTLEELHGTITGGRKKSVFSVSRRKGSSLPHEPTAAVKFGWIQGVFVRCLLNIWGVMLFLRLSWVVGQAGIGLGLLVIFLSTAVTTLTTLSMSAICTNGEVKGGGTYYMISRSLGPEFGGSIGLIFALANAVAAAMYSVGFAETAKDIMKNEFNEKIVDADINDIRIISCVTMVVLLGIALIGTQWESKAQLVLLVILLTALADFFVGSFLSPSPRQRSLGFLGWKGALAEENLKPNFRKENFFSVFAIFFPAATGITAGANISGDLKDPQKSIPKGTMLAIGATTLSYIAMALTVGSTMLRDAVGPDGMNDTTLALLDQEDIANCTPSCSYGLLNHFQVIMIESAFPPLIYAGIFAATLSSALASLVSAPKIFQALCKDRLFPYIHVFAKGYGKNAEPRRGYILAFVIALACCAFGDLNAIAPIISNFFLAAYCLMNFSCFHALFARSPGFRPAFKYCNKWLSLLGAALCLVVMFIINWRTALGTFALVLALYLYLLRRKPDVNWGSSAQAQLFRDALKIAVKLNHTEIHVKNYRPQVLALTGTPSSRPVLLDFGSHITKKLGVLVCGHILSDTKSLRVREAVKSRGQEWLEKSKNSAFYSVVLEESLSAGVRSLLQLVGLGKLRPNFLLMGYKGNWLSCPTQQVKEYFQVIHDAFDMNFSLAILRLPNGQDYSAFGDFEDVIVAPENEEETGSEDVPKPQEEGAISSSELQKRYERLQDQATRMPGQDHARIMRGLSRDVSQEVLSSAGRFQEKQQGTIDVWWLYDDGGLTMLIPYILRTRSQWNHCQLRVFSLANKKEELDRDHRNMAALLNKFRIDYSDVTVIPDITRKPLETSIQEFEKILNKWQDRQVENENKIMDSEIFALQDKTNRHIRLKELLLEYSSEAGLIIMTLPMPRKNTCSAPMFMAWLEILTKDLPPYLFVRGNQTSVLTFYS